jgi:hypothetical protein
MSNAETIVKLSTPIRTHDGMVSELKLKAPKVTSIVKHGDPFTIRSVKDSNGEHQQYEYVYDNKAVFKFASDMSGIDDILLSDLSVSDFISVRNAIKDIVMELVPEKNPSEQPGT